MNTEVENLLTKKGIVFHSKGKDLLVKCLNPEHEDSNPSLRIDREDGMFHCLSCGYKGNIFSLFNKYRNVFNSKVRKVQKTITEIRRASWSGFSFPQDAFFMSKDTYRGIPPHILEEFQAFTTSEMGMEDRLVFPIYDQTNIIVGFQGRKIFSDTNPKYLAYPKEQPLPWYPNVYKIEHEGSIILVEGLRDALILRTHGIKNAVCIFGTKSVNQDNILEHLTPYMLVGVTKVFLLMDGDSAGRSAAKHLELCITRKTDLEVQILDLPDDMDPATLDDATLKSLKNQLKTY